MVTLVSIVIFFKDLSEEGLSVWVQKRFEGGPMQGLLEYPGGKIRPNESSRDAAIREVEEEVGITIEGELPLFKRHIYKTEEKEIVLHVHFSNFALLPTDKGEWLSLKFETKTKFLKGKIPWPNHDFTDLFLDYIKRQSEDNSLECLWSM